jgi:5-methylcytosine-specific restriction endonuclease McrA
MARANFKNKRVKLSREDYEAQKNRIFEKYGWRCARCHQLKPLTLDHKKKRSQLGGDEEDNLQPLCAKCHDYLDNRGGKKRE